MSGSRSARRSAPSRPEGPGSSEPWGVELASGQRCVLLQGAHSLFAGRVIDYYCNASLSLLRGLTEGRAGLARR